MEARPQKEQVLGDYAILLKALLPQAAGFQCHDREGQLIWQSLPASHPTLGGAYDSALAAVLREGVRGGQGVRIGVGTGAAYLVRMEGDRQQSLGALTVLVGPAGAGLAFDDVVARVRPAVRSLQRELSLRFRLLDGYKKLSVQAAEEKLLHEVDRATHQPLSCDAALQSILALCEKYLQVRGLMLVIPDKRISLVRGSAISEQEADLMCENLLQQADRAFDDAVADDVDDLVWLPIEHSGRKAEGIFALSGWRQSDFSLRRRSRVVRYIVSHIEHVLDRDYDALTGLMAWPVFERELIAACNTGGEYTVVYFNIDQLHVVNDTFGRESGDEVLVRFAALVRDAFPDHAVTRITGDNFAALLHNVHVRAARKACEQLGARFREQVHVRGDQTYRASVSIGVGPLDAGPENAGAALAPAQVACKAAKERGRGRVEVYEASDVSIIRRLDDIQLVGFVRSAIENDRMVLMGQPIMALRPGQAPHYYEVLVRMLDDGGGHVSPADFMKAAERYQLMEELDRWVVANTLRLVAAAAADIGRRQARFAINLSGQSLGNDAFLPYVQEQFALSGVPPEMITFEITESVAVTRMRQAQAFMHELKKIGCKFSLDDFGTGLSSFAYLKLFPVDTLKIDGSFIRDIAANVVSQSVVAAIAEVARVMQLDTVAEYVQDDEALKLLRNLGVTYAQGYLVGAPELLSEKLNIVSLAADSSTIPAAPSSA
jgi:diguanylate cyclase (GGDEF)-like protein